MKFSQFFVPTMIEEPTSENISQKLMLKAGMIKQVENGLFVYLPTFLRVVENVNSVIRKHLENAGASEVKFPILIGKDILTATNRWDSFGKEMFTLKDRNEKEYAISPTNEEYACFLAKSYLKSYKDLPLSVFQIQQKHRDEISPRGGVMRAREFIMKDCYSFHNTHEELEAYYAVMAQAYKDIFAELGLKVAMVQADSGVMGGKTCHEFMALTDNGNDDIAICDCGFAANMETLTSDVCPTCGKVMTKTQGNELGHIFQLGKRYTDVLNISVLDENNKDHIITMGCYGIGIERVISAIIEQHHDERGIAWPENVAPFKVNIITINPKDEAQFELSKKIYEELKARNVKVLWDDRNARYGVKLADSELIGIPFNIIVGKNAADNNVEFQPRCGEKTLINADDVLVKFN